MRKDCTLDSLLGPEEPHASFHDASVQSVHVDYVTHEFGAAVELRTGDPVADDEQERNRRRRGRLTVQQMGDEQLRAR